MTKPWLEDSPRDVHWADEKTGYDCYAHRRNFWCGYVKVPTDHLLHGVGYNQTLPEALHPLIDSLMKGAPIGKRGVFTLIAAQIHEYTPEVLFDVHGSLTYSGDRTKSGEFWYGFDCGHAGDFCYYPGLKWRQEPDENEIWRDLPYVRAECASLALQLQRIVK